MRHTSVRYLSTVGNRDVMETKIMEAKLRMLEQWRGQIVGCECPSCPTNSILKQMHIDIIEIQKEIYDINQGNVSD